MAVGRTSGHVAYEPASDRSGLVGQLLEIAVALGLQCTRLVVQGLPLRCVTAPPRASFRHRPRVDMSTNAAHTLGRLAVALWILLPCSRAAAGEKTAPLDLALDVRVSVGGSDEAALQQAIEDRVRGRLDELGHAVRPDEPVDLDVSVGWYDEAETTYVLTIVIRRNGELINHATETCPRCGTTELFELLATRIDRAEEHLASLAARATPQAPMPAASGEAVPVPASRRPSLTALGWSGVAVAGVGLVASAVGAGIWSKGEVIDVDSRDEQWLVGRDYRPPGIALVATGGAVLVGGVVMLAVDLARARHRRVQVMAAFDRVGVSAGITGRF